MSDEVIERALHNIYRRNFNPKTDIEPGFFHAFVSTLNAAADKGIRQAQKPEDDFLNALRHNTAVFAAFKTHRLQNDVARQLMDSNGNLKPFERWKNDVQDITSHQCKAWLRTEYDTAVLRARQAANWQQFQREKDVLPNLEWMPSTSPNPGADHMPFWGTILPVDHPFWEQHRPGDRWNCKCDLRATDKPTTTVPADPANAHDPQPGLDSNPGRTAQLFAPSHPYIANAYPGAREAVEKAVRKEEFQEIKKEARKTLQGTTISHPKLKGKIKISRRSIDEWTNQPHIHYQEKNLMILSIGKVLQNAKYLGKKTDVSQKAGTKFVHIFEIEIKADKSWIIVKEYQDGSIILYSVSDSPNVLIGLNKK